VVEPDLDRAEQRALSYLQSQGWEVMEEEEESQR
jgi:hypothetical protein